MRLMISLWMRYRERRSRRTGAGRVTYAIRADTRNSGKQPRNSHQLAVPPLAGRIRERGYRRNTGRRWLIIRCKKTAKTASLVIRSMGHPLGFCIRVGAFGGGAYMHAV